MQGRIHRANIYRRVTAGGSTTWESTPFIRNYECRVDSISPTAVLREQYATCTHSAVGEPNNDIAQGMWMVMTSGGWSAGKEFKISGVRALDAGTPGPHHLEFMLTESRLPRG